MAIKVHTHPLSTERVYGERLQPGETIESGDVYDSTDGKWRKCPNPGTKVPKGNHVIYIRPKRIPN